MKPKRLNQRAFVGPAEKLAKVHQMASHTFCAGGKHGLQTVALCRRHGPDRVLETLQAEGQRAEMRGSWGKWNRFFTELERPKNSVPYRRNP